jgi:predicted DNA-binding transcriptional regulator AlpA
MTTREEATGRKVPVDSPYLDLNYVAGHFGGRSRSGVYSLISQGILSAPVKVGNRSFWTRPMIAAADAKIMGERSAN